MKQTDLEQEHKFAISRAEAEAFFARVAPHLSLEIYDEARPVAFTRTTYLDTDELEYLRTSAEPIVRRLRVREYAAAITEESAPVLTGVAYLELKATSGASRMKARLAAPPAILAQLLSGAPVDPDWCDAMAAVMGDSVVPARLAAGDLRPRVTTFYRRASLVGDRVRVTFDEGLYFAPPPAPGEVGTAADPPSAIGRGPRLLEVKTQGMAPRWLEQELGGLTEASGLSKYHLAMSAGSNPRDTRRTSPIAIPALRVRGT